jgi:NTE family protein
MTNTIKMTALAGKAQFTAVHFQPCRDPAPIRTPRLLGLLALLFTLSGCTTYGVVENKPMAASGVAHNYSVKAYGQNHPAGDVLLILAFSGGGTRASAMSYGVLQELRDTPLAGARLLDEVDSISSVSGGSFTAAYYGLHGEGIFDTYEDAFLKRDVEGDLFAMLFNPLTWLSPEGRTDMTVDYYERSLFHNATFADLAAANGPMIMINSSDLGSGARFSFVQEYFNLLCSDLSSFSVARAVTASSAVPVVFQPVVLQNFDECGSDEPDWLVKARKRADGDQEMAMVVDGIQSYFDKENRKYAHFVDGGITDNLGLRAIYEIAELEGGAMETLRKNRHGKIPRRIVLVSVDASTSGASKLDLSNAEPSLIESIEAMSDVQLHRYNVDTSQLMSHTLKRWRTELSTPAQPVKTYFIRLGFNQIPDAKERKFLNAVPTSFDMTEDQVKRVTAAGRQLLRDNPDFKRLLKDLGGG